MLIIMKVILEGSISWEWVGVDLLVDGISYRDKF